MCQSQPLYATSPALALLSPWMSARLPSVVDPVAKQHIIQLTAGIFERQSALVSEIAKSSAFGARTDSSNQTQVRRILRDERLFLCSVYYPFIRQLLSEMTISELYLTIDESSHLNDFNIFGVALATDAMSIPLGWLLYDTDDAWAEDAREMLHTLARYLPGSLRIIVLADRIHTGEAFLECLEQLGWHYVFRAAETTQIETSKGWKALRSLRLHARQGRFFQQVRVWKSRARRTNVSCYKLPRKGHRPAIWFLVSSLAAAQERFVEYACRWWHECGWKSLKSALFDWERGRVREFERVEVLLIGMSCALWALWLLGRAHEHIPRHKPSTTKPQSRRKSIVQEGISAFILACKQQRQLTLTTPPKPRVLDYSRQFVPLA
jgi:hypothetical protein